MRGEGCLAAYRCVKGCVRDEKVCNRMSYHLSNGACKAVLTKHRRRQL